MNPTIFQSFLYAHLIGLFLVIISLVVLFRLDVYEQVFKTAQVTAFNMFVCGLLMIILGIIFIQLHNVWVLKPRLVVTLLAWSVFIKGVFLVVLPESAKNVFYRWNNRKNLKILFSIYFILGFVLVLDSIRLLINISKTENIYAHLLSGVQQMIA